LRRGKLLPVIDDEAKDYLTRQLRGTRQALVWKLDGLSEYDIRRPLTDTGTNLLGLVKHLATCEAWYFGEVFDRPFPQPLLHWREADGSDMWATHTESREDIIGFYHHAWDHADATIAALPLDAPGHVPWWPSPDVKLFTVMVHVLQDTSRHAGHADILREHLDGRTGARAEYEDRTDPADRAALRAKIEAAAQAAANGAGHADPT
jgi:hypothetical protein